MGAVTTVRSYFAGSQRVAMRAGNTLSFLVGDHLGSTALTLNSAGAKVAELRYKPWGERRYTWGSTPTQRQYTGQILDENTDLYFYNARYYDPLLGRFIQADTIVPDPGNPQAFNRYSYSYNSPVKYVDPDGHDPQYYGDPDLNDAGCTTDWCWQNRWYMARGWFYNPTTAHWDVSIPAYFYDEYAIYELLDDSGMAYTGNWTFNELTLVGEAVADLAKKVNGTTRINELLGPGKTILYRWDNPGPLYGCRAADACAVIDAIFFFDSLFNPTTSRTNKKGLVIHELAHVMDTIGPRGILGGFSRSFPVGPEITSHSGTGGPEYWAESMARWVYGSGYKSTDRIRGSLTTDQSDFIDKWVVGN